MLVKQISVFVENKPGRLAEITSLLADANVNLRAVSIGDTTDFGILRMIVDKPEVAEKALKDAEMAMSVTQVLALAIEDVPGGFSKAVKILSQNGVSIEYMYAFNTGHFGKASIIIRVNDNEEAIKTLSDNGFILISEEEIQAN
ncbi:MAG: ACT domain-containing protein [Bacillota bacterium]|nr:ACT domain-containing protein [Bacillota bacterium]